MSDFKIVKLLDPITLSLNGPSFTGAYDNEITYGIGQSVSYLGSSYVAYTITNGNLPTDTAFWQLLAEKGDQGDQGVQGVQGESWQEQFETVSKNLKSWNVSINYSSGDISSIVYTDGISTITKTFNYTSGDLTSLVLSGDTPTGINLTKTFNYSGSDIVGWSYS